MRKPRSLGSFAAALACINLLVPLQLLSAADPPAVISPATATASSNQSSSSPRETTRPVTRDVSLGADDGLRGTLVGKNGAPLANRVVVAVHADKSQSQSISDTNGNFCFLEAKPGLYQVASEGSYQVCRCWAARTAPPAASAELLLVEGSQTLRGQKPIGELLCGPVLIGLIIAAAIIIPIAVHNSKKSAS